MSNLLTLNQDDRASVDQVKKSKESIEDIFRRYRNEMSSIMQRQVFIEQERAVLFKNMKKQFSSDYEAIKQNVKDLIKENEDDWNSILQTKMPIEFQKQVEEQKKFCDEIIAKKLEFIHEMEGEVITRDHEYVNKTAEQNKRIDEIVKLMRTQEASVRKAVQTEINKIVSSYEQERAARSFLMDKEIKTLSAKRQEKEAMLMNQVIDTARQKRDELEKLRQDHNEEFIKLRKNLEVKLQATQQEHEDRLAQYLYSLEQLEYDYKILQENKEEHEEKLKMQTNKMVRQRELLRRLKTKYYDEDSNFSKINSEITHDYKRIAQSYRDLQLRFRNVAYTDFNTFRQVWNMNEKRLHDLVLKTLSANRVVMEQQLGKESNNYNPEVLKRWVIETDEFEDLTKTPQPPTLKNAEEQGKKNQYVINQRVLSPPLEHLRRMLTDEVGFIVDERVKSIFGISGDFDSDDAQMYKMDALMKDLNITDPQDEEVLLSYFLREPEFGSLEAPSFIKPHKILEGLRTFVNEYSKNQHHNQISIFSQITSDATQNTSSEVARAIMQLQAKMKKQLPAQKLFWEKKSSVVTEEMWRLWSSTYKGMQRYHQALDERSKLIEETTQLKTQNEELERLLSNYVSSKTNNDLIYPPVETVDFNVFEE